MKNNYIEHRTACFACTTPYQLLGAINIVQFFNLDADMYLFGLFDEYQSVATCLQREGIFKKVIPVDCLKYLSVSPIKALWQVINSRKEVKYYLPSTVKYDFIYSTSKAHVKTLLFYELKRRNKDVKYVFYEDGTGTYEKYSTQLNKSIRRYLSEIIIGQDIFAPSKTSIVIRFPNLLDLPVKMKNVPVVQLPPLEVTPDFKRMLHNVFSVKEKDLIRERVIIFDIARGVYSGLKDMMDTLDNCYNELLKLFDYNELLLKDHPKCREKSNVSIRKYNRQCVPIEALYASMDNLDNRILIGMSTALFSPKLLFGKEPFLISLHKIAWPDEIGLDELYKKLRKMYNHNEKVFAPRNIDELISYIKRIQSQ